MNNSNNHKGKIVLRVVLIILGLFFLALITIPVFLKVILTPERGYLSPWENVSAFDFEENYGIEIRKYKEAADSDGLKGSTKYWYDGTQEKPEDYLTFYFFDTKRDATKGMDKLWEQYFDNEEVVIEALSEYVMEGWIARSPEQETCLYVYQFRNMIITCNVKIINANMPEPTEDIKSKNDAKMKIYNSCKQFINEHFVEDENGGQ